MDEKTVEIKLEEAAAMLDGHLSAGGKSSAPVYVPLHELELKAGEVVEVTVKRKEKK